MLQSLEVRRFKSILNQRVEFGRVNLFVGGNGAGKSNLLEALGVASAALARSITDVDLVTKGVRLSTPSFFKSAFKNRQLPSTFRIETAFSDGLDYNFDLMASDSESNLRFKTESAHYGGRTVFGRSGNGATLFNAPLAAKPNALRSMYDQLRSVANFDDHIVAEFDDFSHYAIYSPQTEFLRGTEVGTAQQPPVGLHGEGLPQAVRVLVDLWKKAPPVEKERLQRAFQLVWSTGWAKGFWVGLIDPKLMSSQIKTGRDTLYFTDAHLNAKRNTVTAYDASEGVLFLLFMVVMLAHPESPKVFALDNVDSALNPRMTKFAVARIAELICSEPGRQVFMTSHNPTSMDAIDIFNPDTRVFTVYRNAEGHTVVHRVKPPEGMSKEDWIAKSGGRSMSELWLADEIPGALGEKIV